MPSTSFLIMVCSVSVVFGDHHFEAICLVSEEEFRLQGRIAGASLVVGVQVVYTNSGFRNVSLAVGMFSLRFYQHETSVELIARQWVFQGAGRERHSDGVMD